MDSIIQVLPENLIQKIAAGEVIERPASVVKELVENAIDAKANKIKVEIKAGGKQLINVVDNGQGMLKEDALKCILRHATSKIKAPSDLFSISTLGFRGEALSSIGAISRMTIQTSRVDNESGTRLVVEGGVNREVVECARDTGTTIQVRNLFFNTPARRKFLRHEDTETRYIARMLIHLSAATPQIGFQFVNREHTVFHYLPAEFQHRSSEILGLTKDRILTCEQEDSGIHIQLCLGKPEFCTKSKQKQFIMVRGRPVYSSALADAVYKGFGSLMPQGRHPLYVLTLDIDPKRVDVNVHPAKREVRFADEQQIVDFIYHTVRQTLDIPETTGFIYKEEEHNFKPVEIIHDKPMRIKPGLVDDIPLFETTPVNTLELPHGEEQLQLGYAKPDEPVYGTESSTRGEGQSQENKDQKNKIKNYAVNEISKCWQVHKKYIVAETKDGVALIHQQRAHERILFEDFLRGFEGEKLLGQRLLFPITVSLSTEEKLQINEIAELWDKLGFEIRDFGQDTIIVDAVPAIMVGQGEAEIVSEVLSSIDFKKNGGSNSIEEVMAKKIAQKASIKAGKFLKTIEMEKILKDLLETRDPFNCPNGKLVIIKLELKEIDQMF